MPQPNAPTAPRNDAPFVDRNGILTPQGYSIMQQLWRQVVAGHVIIPVQITNVGNLYTLVPKLHEEGANAYGDHMAFFGPASAASTGSATAKAQSASGQKILSTVKVYKSNGAAQAGNTDIVNGAYYLWIYAAALDGGAGGFILK